jgi:hypothetical protein
MSLDTFARFINLSVSKNALKAFKHAFSHKKDSSYNIKRLTLAPALPLHSLNDSKQCDETQNPQILLSLLSHGVASHPIVL